MQCGKAETRVVVHEPGDVGREDEQYRQHDHENKAIRPLDPAIGPRAQEVTQRKKKEWQGQQVTGHHRVEAPTDEQGVQQVDPWAKVQAPS